MVVFLTKGDANMESEDYSESLIEFNATMRCDVCGAQSYTMAHRDDMPSELLFCAHHSKKYRENLLDEGWTVIDDVSGLESLSPTHYLTV